jgi:Ser/Thr protein kinase RdoA (MazF antagonist)
LQPGRASSRDLGGLARLGSIDTDYERVADEFGLGQLLAAWPLAAGHPGVAKLTTTRGSFVVKPAYSVMQAELAERAAVLLSQEGVSQARLLRTTSGALIGASGHAVQEFLHGRACLHPTPAQTVATMRHIGVYHAALGRLPAPPELAAEDTLWQRVASPGYLMAELPGLLRRSGLPTGHQGVIGAALDRAATALPLIERLPAQVVHGDIGPDNVLMDGDEVVAIVDFTPYCKPVLFAMATAVYWYHLYGHRTLDPAAVRASVTALRECHEWTAIEVSAWPAMLLLEALRRLATTLALAEETGTHASGGLTPRYDAVGLALRS